MRALITKQENQQKELRAFSFSRLFSELTNFASLVLDRVQKRGEILYHEFRMQFAETKKRTTLTKRTAFRRKALWT
ncbi:hypothetical protein FFZ96_00705 [Leptospira borgpetersenii]|nr:hypothetical protein LBHB_02510 [Leptospira borgpetersenii serovar Hardjo]TQE59278.1 hypothetical protein FFZ96_00705 [Leptospira borgpetersenii]